MISNIILFIALSALVTYCIIWFVSVYCNSKLYSNRRISFNKFLAIYENAPEKVDLYEGRFSYSYWDETCYNTSNKISFYFSIPDTIRYECWRKEKKREEEKEVRRRRSRNLLPSGFVVAGFGIAFWFSFVLDSFKQEIFTVLCKQEWKHKCS